MKETLIKLDVNHHNCVDSYLAQLLPTLCLAVVSASSIWS